jgi:methanogenic corrinoid protein MtbC1
VERLALLHNASRAGRSIAALAPLSTDELRRIVAEDAEHARARPNVPGAYRDQAMVAVAALDTDRLEAVMRRAVLSLGAIPFLEDVVAPLLVQIGDAWHERRIGIAHEHAASATLIHLLGWLTRSLEEPAGAPAAVLATPHGERHALGAMMAAAAAAHDGWRVTWLGTDLPAAQIAAGGEQSDARIVALSVASVAAGVELEVSAVRALVPQHVPVVVGGAGAGHLPDVPGVTRVRDLAHWRVVLGAHATGTEIR